MVAGEQPCRPAGRAARCELHHKRVYQLNLSNQPGTSCLLELRRHNNYVAVQLCQRNGCKGCKGSNSCKSCKWWQVIYVQH